MKCEKENLHIKNILIEKENLKYNEVYEKAQKLQMEKYRNESYFLKCERDQLKLQLKELNNIKDKYDQTTQKIKKKYENSKTKIKELMSQNDLIEKISIEFKDKIQAEIEIVNI